MTHSSGSTRYRIIKPIASGGMAEVFLAEAEAGAIGSARKRVAIKRVLPSFASNERFIRMFQDEARLSMQLAHQNCVQVFDVGFVEGSYFIVMEYVDGTTLKAVNDYFRRSDLAMPVACAVWMGMEICRGLHYAHTLEDYEGNLLHIVHRDLSPANVLLSKNGEVKIADFGLAKAAASLKQSPDEPGLVPGKLGYLAPETARGEPATPRADLFAVGIILWETLARRRLFLGHSDRDIWNMVQKSAVPPPRKINPAVPASLEAVVLRALERDPARRFQSAREFGEALEEVYRECRYRGAGFEIGQIVRMVLGEKSEASVARKLPAEVVPAILGAVAPPPPPASSLADLRTFARELDTNAVRAAPPPPLASFMTRGHDSRASLDSVPTLSDVSLEILQEESPAMLDIRGSSFGAQALGLAAAMAASAATVVFLLHTLASAR